MFLGGVSWEDPSMPGRRWTLRRVCTCFRWGLRALTANDHFTLGLGLVRPNQKLVAQASASWARGCVGTARQHLPSPPLHSAAELQMQDPQERAGGREHLHFLFTFTRSLLRFTELSPPHLSSWALSPASPHHRTFFKSCILNCFST